MSNMKKILWSAVIIGVAAFFERELIVNDKTPVDIVPEIKDIVSDRVEHPEKISASDGAKVVAIEG